MNIKKNISYKKTMERKFILASNNNGKIREMKEKCNCIKKWKKYISRRNRSIN